MKFITSSAKLLNAIKPLTSIAGNNPTLPIIENILLELENKILSVKATDLETTIINRIDVESESNDSIAVNAKLLFDTLKAFPEQPLTFKNNSEKNILEITAEQGDYSIAYVKSEEFPNTPTLDNSKSTQLTSETLKKGIKNTLFATSNDELRPVIAGVYIEINNNDILFVGTDAHKLVKYNSTINSTDSASFIVPKKPLQLLKNILEEKNEDINIKYNKTNMIFILNNMEIYCRLVDGNYPNYEAVIPKENPNHLSLCRADFLNSLKRISIFSNQSTRQIKIQIHGNEIKISGEDIDFSNKATEQLKCEYNGNDIEIGFNGKFLIEVLNTLQSEKISMHFSTPSKAAVVKPESQLKKGEEILMLVMPVMLNPN